MDWDADDELMTEPADADREEARRADEDGWDYRHWEASQLPVSKDEWMGGDEPPF